MTLPILDALKKAKADGTLGQIESAFDAVFGQVPGWIDFSKQLDDLIAQAFAAYSPASGFAMDAPASPSQIAVATMVSAPVEGGVNAMVTALGHADGAPAARPSAAPRPNGLIVAFSAGASEEARAAAVKAFGGTISSTLRSDADGELVVVKLNEGVAASAAIAGLQQSGLVRFAEVDHAIGVQALSNDSYYTGGSLWGMYGDQTSPVNQYGSQAGEAWAMGYTGSSKVVVGVVDTGIDYTHQDLYLNVWLNQGELPTNLALVDTDSDGLITFRDLNQSANSGFVFDVNANAASMPATFSMTAVGKTGATRTPMATGTI